MRIGQIFRGYAFLAFLSILIFGVQGGAVTGKSTLVKCGAALQALSDGSETESQVIAASLARRREEIRISNMEKLHSQFPDWSDQILFKNLKTVGAKSLLERVTDGQILQLKTRYLAEKFETSPNTLRHFHFSFQAWSDKILAERLKFLGKNLSSTLDNADWGVLSREYSSERTKDDALAGFPDQELDNDDALQGLTLEQYGYHRGDYQLLYNGIVTEKAKFDEGIPITGDHLVKTTGIPSDKNFVAHFGAVTQDGAIGQSLKRRIDYIFRQYKLRSGMPEDRVDKFWQEEFQLDPRRVHYIFYIDKKTNEPVGAIRLFDGSTNPGSFGRGEGGPEMGVLLPPVKTVLETDFPELLLPERTMPMNSEIDRPSIYELGRLTHDPNFEMTTSLFRTVATYLMSKNSWMSWRPLPFWSGVIYAASTREKAFGHVNKDGRKIPGYVEKYGWTVAFTDKELKAAGFPRDAVVLKYDVADFCAVFGQTHRLPQRRVN